MELLLEYEFMRLEKSGKLAWVTFTRERYLNAMNNSCAVQINGDEPSQPAGSPKALTRSQ